MRVLALGGCGGMGRYATRTLLECDDITEIVVADLDGEAAAAWAAELGDIATSMAVDVTDEAGLMQALSGVDLVMNTVGPYFRFGVPTLKASLEAGCHYADVCDDWEPTLDMLALDDLAKARGVTAIIGLGISPGVTNLLAARAISELDSTEELLTGWDLESAKPEVIADEPAAATIHGIQQLTGTIRVRRGGEFVDEKPTRKVLFEYPGLGPVRGFSIGHPEPVTLPRTFPEIQDSLNLMIAKGSKILGIRALGWLVNHRWMSPRRAGRWAERDGGPGGEAPALPELVARAESGGQKAVPPIFALARGVRGGEPASVAITLAAAPAGGMGGVTGVPLGVAVRLMAAGQVDARGVLAPEAALDPQPYFDALAPRCSPAREDGADLLLTTRSWEETTLLEVYQAAMERARELEE